MSTQNNTNNQLEKDILNSYCGHTNDQEHDHDNSSNDNCGCCDDNNVYDSGCDSDSEEYHQFIDKMNSDFMNFQTMYKGFCDTQGREFNLMEMMSMRDILQGGSGKFICIAGEEDIEEKDKQFITTMEDLEDN